jgi:hypothetical protein
MCSLRRSSVANHWNPIVLRHTNKCTSNCTNNCTGGLLLKRQQLQQERRWRQQRQW